MLIKNAINAQNQSIYWRQAISQSKYKKFSWKNCYIYPLTKWGFSYRNYQSYLTDIVILGSNPIITHLLLIKLYKENLNNFVNHGNKIKVTILKDNNHDYWSYHSLKQKDYIEYINHKANMKLEQIEDLFNLYSEIYEEESPLEISVIPNTNMSVYYYFQKPEFVDGYVFHLQDKTVVENDYQKSMPNVMLLENNIKEHYWYLLKNKFNKNAYVLNYEKEKNKNKDNDIKTHLLLTKKILLTSTAYWVNSQTHVEEKQIENEKFMVTKMTNELKEVSYGSAKESAVDFINNKLLCLNEIINLLKDIKN